MDKSKKEYAEGLLRFDDAFEDGMYTDPNPKEPQPNYRFRDLDRYCKAKGVEPTDLSEEELRQFRSDIVITKEEREGKTPNGGVCSEIYYQNELGNPVDKSSAKRVCIRESDAKGNLVRETYGTINHEK